MRTWVVYPSTVTGKLWESASHGWEGFFSKGGQWYQPVTADCVGGSVRQSCAGTRADGNESAYGMLTAKAGCLKYQQYMIPISTIISLSYE